jgi:hypothetical protein
MSWRTSRAVQRRALSITGSNLVKILDKRETLFISEDGMPVLFF